VRRATTWARERARLDARDRTDAADDPEWCDVCGGACACVRQWPGSVDCQVCKYMHALGGPQVSVQHTANHETAEAVEQLPPWYRMTATKETRTMQARPDGIHMTEREARVAERYGFTAEDLTEVSRKEFVRTVAASEQRNADKDAVVTTFSEIGREFNLNPDDYRDRLKIGEILMRRGHPLARSETYGSGRR
jgi:hypothetical protein